MTLQDTTKVKIGYIFIIGLVNFAGMLPIQWKKFRANETFLSILNSFAAGVFLSMAFVHILPESVANYTNIMYEKRGFNPVINNGRLLQSFNQTGGQNSTETGSAITDGTEYPHLFPVPYLLFLSGYAMVLVIDRIAKRGEVGRAHSHGGEDGHNHFPDLDQFDDEHEVQEKHEHNHDHQEHGHHHHHKHDHTSVKTENGNIQSTCKVDVVIHCENNQNQQTRKNSTTPLKIPSPHCDFEVSPDNCLVPIQCIADPDLKHEENSEQIKEVTHESKVSVDQASSDHGEINDLEQVKEQEVALPVSKKQSIKMMCLGLDVTPLILTVSLGFHSFFEGLALGLVPEMHVLIDLMIGVAIHQFVASLSLGIAFTHKKNQNLKVVTLIFTGFALCQSVGLAIGIGLTSAPDIISAIILSIAGGTFVYIACSEIIVHEFAKPTWRWTKMLMFLVGVAVICSVWFLG